MMRLILVLGLTGMLFTACKDEAAAIRGKDLSKEIIAVKDLPLFTTCDLLSKEFLMKEMNADDFTFNSKNGGSSETTESCFFQWTTASKPNAGVMLQIMKNAFEEETPVWATEYINGMKAGNAGTATGSEMFKEFDGAGDDGVYSNKLSQYFWRLGNNYVFMLAFNLDNSEEEKLEFAKELAEETMTNFKARLKAFENE
ncbi:MAG TPA: hypothetical protein PLZ32_21060 [Saprospiraceae bacterium]|nr:hypothetical protein [Saprospiraceae bacterium]